MSDYWIERCYQKTLAEIRAVATDEQAGRPDAEVREALEGILARFRRQLAEARPRLGVQCAAPER